MLEYPYFCSIANRKKKKNWQCESCWLSHFNQTISTLISHGRNASDYNFCTQIYKRLNKTPKFVFEVYVCVTSFIYLYMKFGSTSGVVCVVDGRLTPVYLYFPVRIVDRIKSLRVSCKTPYNCSLTQRINFCFHFFLHFDFVLFQYVLISCQMNSKQFYIFCFSVGRFCHRVFSD